MRKLFGFLTALCLWFGLATTASAQARVGICTDTLDGIRLDIWERTRVAPNGYTDRVSEMFEVPSGVMHRMSLDPSGMTLFGVEAIRPDLRIWIQRDGTLIGMSYLSPTNFTVRPIGTCQLNMAWLNSLPQPQLLPVGPMAPITFDYNPQMAAPEMGAIAASMAGMPGVPFNLYSPGNYMGVPPLMSTQQATDCINQSGSDEESFYSCAVGSYMGKKERAAYDCVRDAEDSTAASLCILKGQLPKGTEQAVSDVSDCYAQYGSKLEAYPYCMAEKQLDPRTAAIVNCMAQQYSQGQQPDAFTLGMCAFGPMFHPNPETTIAIQCAVATKGQPHAFVACTGGMLMERELDKCLKYGVGTDNGCFGPNNSIKLAYDQIENQLRQVLGANSVAFHAWQLARLSMDPYKMAEATRNVIREVDRVRQNANAALRTAAQQAATAIDNATPDVTVGRSSNGLPSVTIRTPHWRL